MSEVPYKISIVHSEAQHFLVQGSRRREKFIRLGRAASSIIKKPCHFGAVVKAAFDNSARMYNFEFYQFIFIICNG